MASPNADEVFRGGFRDPVRRLSKRNRWYEHCWLWRMRAMLAGDFNFGKRTIGDFFEDLRKRGWDETVADRRMWGQMRMNPTDMVDVSGYTYTYLMNGIAPANN